MPMKNGFRRAQAALCDIEVRQSAGQGYFDRWFGKGTFISPQQLVTANHVIQNGEIFSFVKENGFRHSLRIDEIDIISDEALDAAIITLPEHCANTDHPELAGTSLFGGGKDFLVVSGHNPNEFHTVRKDEDLTKRLLQNRSHREKPWNGKKVIALTGEYSERKGDSGAPMLTPKGEVASILVGSSGQDVAICPKRNDFMKFVARNLDNPSTDGPD